MKLLHAMLLTSALAAFDASGATRERMEQQAKAYADQGRFTGTVVVAHDGRIVYSQSFGLADEEWGISNSLDTKFRLGSMTKQFTAMAILLLEQQGKLKLDDPVCQYLKSCPDSWKPITLQHLLTHTSGLANFTSLPEYGELKRKQVKPEDAVIAVKSRPLEFEPGARFLYSNTGYMLLGAVLEKASGMAYPEFMQRFVFDPLEMKDTGVDDHGRLIVKRAKGYVCTPKCGNADFIDMTVPHAAGAMYSTATDLVKWDAAIRAGKLLTPENHTRWVTPVKSGYAYGWFTKQTEGMLDLSHGGLIDGFSSMIVRFPEKGVVAVALSNHLPTDSGKVANDLARLEAGIDVKLPEILKEIHLSDSILRQYVGVYEFSPAFAMTVTLEDGGLVTRATNQSKVPIFAKSETEFFPKLIDALLRFEKDTEGRVSALVLMQGGRQMKAARKP